MTTKDKNKLKPKTKSKILVLGFLFLMVLAGTFVSAGKARAETEAECRARLSGKQPQSVIDQTCNPANGNVTPNPPTTNANGTTTTTNVNGTATTTPTSTNALVDNLKKCDVIGTGSIEGCIQKIAFFVFYGVPSLLLIVAAKLFNVLISMTLSSTLFAGSTFIPAAWGIVRDLSNIFFILILLYVAIQIILDLGHDSKKIIVQVIIMALLINFSMFFTEVIIDTSNALALVFYNKLNVDTKNPDGTITPRPYVPATKYDQKDISGGMVSAFDPSQFLTQGFFDKLKNKTQVVPATTSSTLISAANIVAAPIYFIPRAIYGYWYPSPEEIPTPMILGIIFISGLIMLFAAYALFMSGMSFLGRLVELWVLIIAAPFAFMSSSLPKLSGIDRWGWEAWLKRLLGAAFMAPAFMFMLYLIFMLIRSNIFNDLAVTSNRADVGSIETIILVLLPAAVIISLLLKATKLAKEGSGKYTEDLIAGAKVLGGLAVGGTALGAAFAGRTLIARGAAATSRTEGAKHYGKAMIEHNRELDKWESGGKTGAKPTWEGSKKAYEAKNPGVKISGVDAIGGRINAAQSRSGEIDHARHEIDEVKKKAGLEGVGDKFLSGVEQEKIEKTFVKEKRSEVESDIKRGYDAKNRDVLIEKDVNGNIINAKGENDYKVKRRQDVINETKRTDPNSIDAAGELNDQGRKQVEDKLNKEFNEVLKNLTQSIGKERFTKLQEEAQQKVGMGTRIASRTTSGTYDVRNIPGLTADKREGLGAKATIGIISAVALGMRAGLKKGAGVEAGSPQGNIFKDLGQTISDSLKHAKIDVKLGDGGGGHGAAHGPTASAHAPDHH